MQHIAVMTERGRLDRTDNPLVSSDTSFYQSKCTFCRVLVPHGDYLQIFAGYLV